MAAVDLINFSFSQHGIAPSQDVDLQLAPFFRTDGKSPIYLYLLFCSVFVCMCTHTTIPGQKLSFTKQTTFLLGTADKKQSHSPAIQHFLPSILYSSQHCSLKVVPVSGLPSIDWLLQQSISFQSKAASPSFPQAPWSRRCSEVQTTTKMLQFTFLSNIWFHRQ